ncbi:MAG TPA: YtxH domain-containing protein [Actinomycetes bacterium]|jgi:gas vesicle protein
MRGKLGIAVGLAAGYVLGTRAGRERYQQLTASAKRLADDPSVKRLQEELNGLFGSAKQRVVDSTSTTVQRVSDQTADKVQQARERTTQT